MLTNEKKVLSVLTNEKTLIPGRPGSSPCRSGSRWSRQAGGCRGSRCRRPWPRGTGPGGPGQWSTCGKTGFENRFCVQCVQWSTWRRRSPGPPASSGSSGRSNSWTTIWPHERPCLKIKDNMSRRSFGLHPRCLELANFSHFWLWLLYHSLTNISLNNLILNSLVFWID